ncbi:MAG: cell division protein FtsW [Planctomycetes bacterium]|nr:cell division protein FtsW [Planctomycetota bacterium]
MSGSNTQDLGRLPLKDNPTGQGLFLAALGLLGVGAVMVYSASAGGDAGSPAARQEIRHLAYAAAAMGVMGLLWRVDYRRLARGGTIGTGAVVLFGAAFALSVLVLIPGIGAEFNGARRWLRIPLGAFTLTFQPSELLKIALVILLACWLGRRGEQVRSFRRTFLPAAALVGACVGVVAVQDFDTGAVIGLVGCCLLLVAGVRWYHLLTLVPPAAAGFVVLVVMNANRWQRITAFLHPWEDTASTWQLRQSLIAVGSGGWWGKGLGNGTTKLGFLPEDRTDFIFSVICEELGFFGGAIVLGLFALIVVFCWIAASRSRGVGRLLATGVGLTIGAQAVLHAAVAIGCAPPTGVTLPLVAAGGTSLLLVAAALAMVISVTAHRGAHDAEDPA